MRWLLGGVLLYKHFWTLLYVLNIFLKKFILKKCDGSNKFNANVQVKQPYQIVTYYK